MPRYTQANRPAQIKSPLGPDVLLLRSVSGEERLGRPFRFEAVCLSENLAIDQAQLVGKGVTIKVKTSGGAVRFFHGLVAQCFLLRQRGRLAVYRLILVPKLALLGFSRDCRIYPNKSHKEIILEVLGAHGITPKESLSGTYPAVEYTVQYRESALAFVSRLMEHNGIYYYFEHDDGKHTLVLCDSPSAHNPFPSRAEIRWQTSESGTTETEGLADWRVSHQLRTETFTLEDFDFKKPQHGALRSSTPASSPFAIAGSEVYDYPALFPELEGADKLRSMEEDRLSKVRAEESQWEHQLFTGEGDDIGLATGCKFTLVNHPEEAMNAAYLNVATTYRLENAPYRANESAGSAAELVLQLSVTAIAATRQFRPPRLMPWPRVPGPHTAIVTGPSGQEIHTDKFGRVKVLFHWDREGKPDENSSCFLRVSQSWAGKGWGAFFLPRVGMEVLVEFLEGDPDRPIITGSVYNAENTPPYPLPANATISTFKSNSSKGGQGFNEIRFEDKKDSEQIFIHAQKNMDVRVKHNLYETTLQQRHVIIGNDHYERVDQDRHEEIKRDHFEKIGRDRHTAIAEKEAVSVGKTFSAKIAEDTGVEVGKNLHIKVAKEVLIEAGTIVLKASDNITLKIGDDTVYLAMTSDGIRLSAPSGDIALDAINIEAKASADFKVEATGNSSVKGTAGLKLEGTAKAELKGAMVDVKGDGMTTVKGGMVQIN